MSTERVSPVKVLYRVRVDAEPGSAYVLHRCQDLEERARVLENWARELEEFVRDHRSQDEIRLTVERETQLQCSGCGREWEEMPPDKYSDEPWCAGCGASVKEEPSNE